MTDARPAVRGSGAGFRADAGGPRQSVRSVGERSDLESSVPDSGTDAVADATSTTAEADAAAAVSPLQAWVREAIAASESAARLAQAQAAETAQATIADVPEGAVASGSSTTELDPTPAAPWPMTLVTPSILPALAADSKTALSGALQRAGIDPSTVKVSYWEELVWFPGGNWINRSLTVETANGQKMDFDAAATLRTPAVTATSVREMINA